MITLLPEAPFAARKRDRLLDYQAYYDEAENLIRRLPNAAKKLGDPVWLDGRDEAALVRLTYARAGYAIDLLSLSYSAGTEVELLREFSPRCLLISRSAKCSGVLASTSLQKLGTSYYLALFKSGEQKPLAAVVSVTSAGKVTLEKQLSETINKSKANGTARIAKAAPAKLIN